MAPIVRPYWYVHKTNAKGRWLGRTVLDRTAIETGRITVNGRRATLYVVRNADILAHATHRHEPLVTADPLRILHDADDLLVIDKPASIPVCFASDLIVCIEPILTTSHKLGVNMVSPRGKPCRTEFRRLSYNGITSLLECIPHTGRTHQIRVHLQFLGHPIANDPLYCCDAWGPDLARGGIDDETAQAVLVRIRENVFPHAAPSAASLEPPSNSDPPPPPTLSPQPAGCQPLASPQPAPSAAAAAVCPSCPPPLAGTSPPAPRADPRPEQLGIYLHAWRYAAPAAGLGPFEAAPPAFAHPGFTGDAALPDEFWARGGRWAPAPAPEEA
ncbi:RNA pseudouridylate synthase domain containing protein 2 [Cladochytrium tenue]|nr:RNA pseudouridylate synthase domain containing protein 2 [Cladochytrium tenue]